MGGPIGPLRRRAARVQHTDLPEVARMSTKAEDFRYWKERSGPKKPKAPARKRRDVPVDTSKPGVSASDRKPARKPSSAAAKKAAYALETSETRPSRRSTRKGKNRSRTDSQMLVKARTNTVRPESRSSGRPR